jgi:hypothetical protein
MVIIKEEDMEGITIDTVTILLDQDMEGTWITMVGATTVVEEEDIMGDTEVHTEMAVFTIG